MPYTKQIDRPKFEECIMKIVEIVGKGPEAINTKGEYFGYWVHRVAVGYVRHPTLNDPFLTSYTFNLDKKSTLNYWGDRAAAFIASAGDMNYVISSVYWGILGLADGVPQANYESRNYFNGCISQVLKKLNVIQPVQASQKDAILMLRRIITAASVLEDVKTECYRTQTVRYEDAKIAENGTLWENGKLLLPSKDLPKVE